MDRTDRNILIVGILIIVLLVAAYYFLLFGPTRQEYLERYAERTQKEQQLAQLEQTVAELENVRRNAPEIERQILEYSKRIPEQGEIPTLLVQIEEVAEGTGVTQFSITPGAPEPPPSGGDYSRIPITMTFLGTYEEMEALLTGVRDLSRLVTVNDITFCRFPEPVSPDASCDVDIQVEEEETTKSQQIEAIVQVEIAAEVYVQPAGAAPTEPAAPGSPPGATASPAGGGTS